MKTDSPGQKSTKARGARRAPGRAWLTSIIGILALTLLAYVPSLDNAFTNWDDNLYVTENPLVHHPTFQTVLTTPVGGNHHPLTIWSLALNYALSGLNPVSYHWLNLGLHLANTLLVFVFVWILSRSRFWTSLATSLFFGIHPMHVESVAWISGRKDVLYGFFFLLGMIAYLRYLDRRRPLWLVAALASSILSAASKPAAVVFPAALLAIDFYRRRRYDLPAVLEKVPFLLVSVAVGIASLHAQEAIGVISDLRPWSPFQRILVASYGTLMYFVKLFVPIHLSAVYPHPNVAGKVMGLEYYLAFAFVVIVLPAIVYFLRRNRAVIFGLAFFFINIVLVLQFFRVGGAALADRYTYLPYVGLFFAVAWLLDERPPPKSLGAAVKPVVAGALLLLAPFSLYQTWRRCDVWQDSGTLWNDTIAKYPRQIYSAYIARGNYHLLEAGRPDAAVADYNEAIALNPGVATGWLDKGFAWGRQNQFDSAYVSFDRALEIDPGITDAWHNRGAIRLHRGDPRGAVADLTRAIELYSGHVEALANRARAYSMLQEYEKSIADGRRALAVDPSRPDVHLEIGRALHQLQRYREAIAEYDEAIRLVPRGDTRSGPYYHNRSYAWAAMGERENALEDAREARRLGAPVDPKYVQGLGG